MSFYNSGVTIPDLASLRARNCALSEVRSFFDNRDYLEVQTRAMRRTTATDPYIESFKTARTGETEPYYLQTSPEYSHKILLSSIRVPIYEIARVFRNEENGTLHRAEFTLVEWYRPEVDYRVMMDETEQLVRAVSRRLGAERWKSCARTDAPSTVSTDREFERLTVSDAFERYAGFALKGLDRHDLYEAALRSGSRVHEDWSYNDLVNCVLVDKIEPSLGIDHPTFLTDYPPTMASLAEIRQTNGECTAERFELYICGIELCNGYTELNDAAELRRRFAQDNEERRGLGLDTLPDDEALLKALPKLGKLGGNALGFERLLMLCLGSDDIGRVMIDV